MSRPKQRAATLRALAEHEPVSFSCSPVLEAQAFVNMVVMGRTTVVAAERDIVMTPEQRDRLLTNFPEDAVMINRMYTLRCATLRRFQRRLDVMDRTTTEVVQ